MLCPICAAWCFVQKRTGRGAFWFYYDRCLDSGPQAVYTIDHSARSYLVDRDGLLGASFAYDTEPHIIATALQWYLAQDKR